MIGKPMWVHILPQAILLFILMGQHNCLLMFSCNDIDMNGGKQIQKFLNVSN